MPPDLQFRGKKKKGFILIQVFDRTYQDKVKVDLVGVKSGDGVACTFAVLLR